MVDSGLAADRGIHLRKQRGGNLHVADAALIARRREARDVADHAAAQRQHGRVAIHLVGNQRVEYPARGLQGLVLLAVRQDAVADMPLRKAAREFCKIQLGDRGIGHDQQIAAGNLLVQQLAIRQQSGTNGDGIA